LGLFAQLPDLLALVGVGGDPFTASGFVLSGLVFVTLLLLSALFSGSEVALFSLGAGEREALRSEGSPAANRVLTLLERPRRLLVSILLLNNVVNVGAAILTAAVMLDLAVRLNWSTVATILIQVVALTFVLLVMSEIVPKLVAAQQPDRFAKNVARPLGALVKVLAPFTDLVVRLTEKLQKRKEVEPLSAEDLKTMADVGQREGTLEEAERRLIHAVAEFHETTAREVMVSRLDIQALPETATLGDALQLIRDTGKSRFPLYRDHLDGLLGVVHAKDLLPLLGRAPLDEPADWVALARQPRFVPLTCPLDDLLRDLQGAGTHMAIVVDEFGGTAGLVTLEDILEEIVGEIRDEHDQPEAEEVVAIGPGRYRVDPRIDLDDLVQALGIEMDTAAFDFETLGGLIFHVAEDIPKRGDRIDYGPLRMRVEAVDSPRILRVLVEVVEVPAEKSEAAE
jgi:CBS domain containing-hemolysin-like protein